MKFQISRFNPQMRELRGGGWTRAKAECHSATQCRGGGTSLRYGATRCHVRIRRDKMARQGVEGQASGVTIIRIVCSVISIISAIPAISVENSQDLQCDFFWRPEKLFNSSTYLKFLGGRGCSENVNDTGLKTGGVVQKFDSLAPARSALAGLWLRPMEFPLLPSVSHDRDCRCRDLQTFRRFPSGSSRKLQKFPKLRFIFWGYEVSATLTRFLGKDPIVAIPEPRQPALWLQMETRPENQGGGEVAARALMNPPSKTNVHAKLLPAILSYGVAAACLYWVFHDLDFRGLFHSFAGVNWWWIPPAILFDLLVYVVAGWEWQLLLRPAGRVSLVQTTQAIFAGRFANDVLPIHVGYVIRIFLVSRWARASAASVAPSLLVERLFDGLWLALGIGLAAIFFPLPRPIAVTGRIWIGIIVFGMAVGAMILFRRPKSQQRTAGHKIARSKWAAKFECSINRVFEQLRAIGRSWLLPAGLGLSLLKLAVQFLAFACLFQAHYFHFPIMVQVAVFLVAYAGLSMPSTPASVGVFQLFCVAALRMFNVPKEEAAGFALLAFGVLTVPLLLAGFFAFAQSGLTLDKVRTEVGEWRSR